jgi:hypothetical protein
MAYRQRKNGKNTGTNGNGISSDELLNHPSVPDAVKDRIRQETNTELNVPVKVGVTAEPLKLQVVIDPESLDAACKSIQDRCNELATHFDVSKSEVNPFEVLFLVADLQKVMVTELKEIRKLVARIEERVR